MRTPPFTRNGMLDLMAISGLIGIALTVHLNWPTFVPGVVGGVLFAMAIIGHFLKR